MSECIHNVMCLRWCKDWIRDFHKDSTNNQIFMKIKVWISKRMKKKFMKNSKSHPEKFLFFILLLLLLLLSYLAELKVFPCSFPFILLFFYFLELVGILSEFSMIFKRGFEVLWAMNSLNRLSLEFYEELRTGSVISTRKTV